MKTAIAAALALTALAGTARAEVAETWETGFALKGKAELSVPAARAYAAIGEIGKWWNGAHSYSGSAANMTVALQPGACFCETLPGGGVEHGRVVMAMPSQGTVRLSAPLGPLQSQGVSTALTFVVKPAGAAASTIEMSYVVSGGKPGMGPMFARGVDGVMTEAFTRYEKYVETGKPE
jgi:hypothetical protein